MTIREGFYIGGAWVAPYSTARLAVENPATEAEIGEVALAGPEDVDYAVAAARAAFPLWAATSLVERVAVLERLLQITGRRLPELARATTEEMGAPATMALADQAAAGLGHLQAILAALEGFPWREALGNGDVLVREPIGVCALITPWNWPVNQIVLKVAPALAAGCTCILKPSELTPLTAILYAEMLDEAGLPPGVFNLIHGLGPEAGEALARHRGVDFVSFTGSTRGGTAVTKAAADTIKRVTLELGGKSPNLVFADCGSDLETRVRASVAECMLNTGQSCDAPTRMIVERSVYDDVCAIAQAAAEATLVGYPAEEGEHIGPLVSRVHWDRVQGHIERAMEEGARLLTGGPGKPQGMNVGHYARPTVFADVTPEMALWREEVFGPVLALTPFEDEADAIQLANDTSYGLAAYLQTGDKARAARVAGAVRAGMVHVNGQGCGWGSPFGGYRMSGNGREGGRLGLEEFLEVKALHMPEGWH